MLQKTPVKIIIALAVVSLGLVGAYLFDKKLNIKNAQDLLSFNKKNSQPTVIERQPATQVNIQTDAETGQPGFSITPPDGWYLASSDETKAKVAFISAENDSIEIDEELVFSLPASVQVNTATVSSYYCDNIDQLVDVHIKTRYGDQGVDTNDLISLQDTKGRLVEVVTQSSDYPVDLHMHERIFCLNNFKFVVSGLSLEKDWQKNSSAILTSLDTFKFAFNSP